VANETSSISTRQYGRSHSRNWFKDAMEIAIVLRVCILHI